MSLAIVNKKFDQLNEKERQLHNYYDPINKHEVQHPNIQDLRDDYLEDFKNYGFNRFQLKENQHDPEEVNKNKAYRQSIETYDQNLAIQRANSYIRPQTGQSSTKKLGSTGSYKNFQKPNNLSQNNRPQTSKKRPQTAIQKPSDIISMVSPQNNFMQQQDQQMRPHTAMASGQQLQRGDKYWINTKKFDKQPKNQVVRNQSALNKIVVDLDDNQYQMAGDLNPIHQHVLSQRLNDQKIYIDKEGKSHNFQRDLDMFQPRKRSPNNKDKDRNYQGFKESLGFVSEKKNPNLYQGISSKRRKPPKPNQTLQNSKKYNSTSNLNSITSFKSLTQTNNLQQNDDNLDKYGFPKTSKSINQKENSNNNNNQQQQQQKQNDKTSPQVQKNQNKNQELQFTTKEFVTIEDQKIQRDIDYSIFNENYGQNIHNNYNQQNDKNNQNNTNDQEEDNLNLQNEIKLRQQKEQNEYKVYKTEKEIIEKMRNIKNLVMSINLNEDQVFVDYKNQIIPSLQETNWQQMKRDESRPFSMIVIDLKTNNYTFMEEVSIENNKLVNCQLFDMARYVNFKRIFDQLYLESDHCEDDLISKPFFYILMYQVNLEDEQPVNLFEKFYFQSYLSFPLDKPIIDILMVFYLRFLMVYDPSRNIQLTDIMRNSLFIVQRKQTVNSNLKKVIEKLKEKSLFLEDQTKKTKRFTIFPLMLTELEGSRSSSPVTKLYPDGNYKLLSKEDDEMIEQKIKQGFASLRPQTAVSRNNFTSKDSQNNQHVVIHSTVGKSGNTSKNNSRPQTAKKPSKPFGNQNINNALEGTQTRNSQFDNFDSNMNSLVNLSNAQQQQQVQAQQQIMEQEYMVMQQMQQQQTQQQRDLQSIFDYKSKEDIINQFSVTTNIRGNVLSPLSSYQVISQKYGTTQYRPKSGKSGIQTSQSKKLRKQNLVPLKEQMADSNVYNNNSLNAVNNNPDKYVHNSIKPPHKKQFSIPNVNYNSNNQQYQTQGQNDYPRNSSKYNQSIRSNIPFGVRGTHIQNPELGQYGSEYNQNQDEDYEVQQMQFKQQQQLNQNYMTN